MYARPFRLLFLFLCSVTVADAVPAQTLHSAPLPIDTYIHQSWDSLTRSTSDCASLTDTKIADPKLTAAGPILYLPAGDKVPAGVKAMQQQCKVDVRNLPQRIKHLGDLSPAQLPAPGLLYLPYPYVVPGGRFNEMYGWDSYFILLGELADNRHRPRPQRRRQLSSTSSTTTAPSSTPTAHTTSHARSRPSSPPWYLSSTAPSSPPTPGKPAPIFAARSRIWSAITPSGSPRHISPAPPAFRATPISATALYPRWPTTATITSTSFTGCSPTPIKRHPTISTSFCPSEAAASTTTLHTQSRAQQRVCLGLWHPLPRHLGRGLRTH